MSTHGPYVNNATGRVIWLNTITGYDLEDEPQFHQIAVNNRYNTRFKWHEWEYQGWPGEESPYDPAAILRREREQQRHRQRRTRGWSRDPDYGGGPRPR